LADHLVTPRSRIGGEVKRAHQLYPFGSTIVRFISTGIAPPFGPLCSILSVSRHPMRVFAQNIAAALQSLCVAPLLIA
jgi:hypothetical protein